MISSTELLLMKNKYALSRFVRTFYTQNVKLSSKISNKRKYLSRMTFSSPAQNIDKTQNIVTNCKSHELFLQNEILHQGQSGIFYYLPLGLRALEKLTSLIDEELQAIGAQKIAMPTLAPSHLWKQTDRWDTPELFKLKDRSSKEFCLGPTHEELITTLVSQINPSLKRFPILLYQITRKFRDEMRPKHGLLRGREFEMKDMYTFDISDELARETYQLVCDTYSRIFDHLGLKYLKVEGATGNIGGSLSHEYHLESSIGEDQLYICHKCGHGSNAELVDPSEHAKGNIKCTKCNSEMASASGIEVGHAFLLGTKYSKVLNSRFKDSSGVIRFTEMGCYGLGVSRILQAGVEVLSPDDQIRWPALVTPYQVCIIPQMKGYMCEKFVELSDGLSDTLTSLSSLAGEVVVDDRISSSVARRLYQATRQGYPYCIVVGRKSLEDPSLYELVDNLQGTKDFLTQDQITDRLRHIQTI